MSYTGYYTSLRPIADDADPHSGARIVDWDGWADCICDRWSVVEDHAVYDEFTERGTYPTRTYKTIRGFAPKPLDAETNDPQLESGLQYHIPRFGLYYGDGFVPFWEDVSRFTEPFAFYHSPSDHPLPSADEVADGRYTEVVHVVARDGELTITTFDLGIVGMEVVQ